MGGCLDFRAAEIILKIALACEIALLNHVEIDELETLHPHRGELQGSLAANGPDTYHSCSAVREPLFAGGGPCWLNGLLSGRAGMEIGDLGIAAAVGRKSFVVAMVRRTYRAFWLLTFFSYHTPLCAA